MCAQTTQGSQTEPRDRLAAMAAMAGNSGIKMGDPFSRVRRTQDTGRSISLSPMEREGKFARNPGELASGNIVDLNTEFDRVKNLFDSLPMQLADLPKMNLPFALAQFQQQVYSPKLPSFEKQVFMQTIMSALQRSTCMDSTMTTLWLITLLHCSTSSTSSLGTILWKRCNNQPQLKATYI